MQEHIAQKGPALGNGDNIVLPFDDVFANIPSLSNSMGTTAKLVVACILDGEINSV